MRWKLARGGAASANDFRDPTSGEPRLALCVYDAAGSGEPRLLALVSSGGDCSGKPCWKQTASGGFRMRSRTGDPDGITDLKLRLTKQGELRLLAKGKGTKVTVPALPLAEPVVVQLVIGVPPDTTCWQATFETASKNGDGLYKARTP